MKINNINKILERIRNFVETTLTESKYTTKVEITLFL